MPNSTLVKIDAPTANPNISQLKPSSVSPISGTATTWGLSEKLSSNPKEVEAAKLLNKIRSLTKKNDPSAAELVELAKTQFGDSKVISLLQTNDEEGEETPQEAGEADEG